MAWSNLPSRRAFTLIELLIVMTIIVVLAGLLLPALGSARKHAALVACASNMRQLMQATLAYSTANDGQLPYCNFSYGGFGDPNAYAHGWLFTNNTAWNQASPPPDGMKTGVLWPYLQSQPVYHCGLDDPASWTGSHWLSSYTMNGAQCGYQVLGYGVTKGIPGYRLTAFKHASEQVLLWESADTNWRDGSGYPNETNVTARHFVGANIACFDGHVEWWQPSDFATQFYLQPGRLWCSPAVPSGS